MTDIRIKLEKKELKDFDKSSVWLVSLQNLEDIISYDLAHIEGIVRCYSSRGPYSAVHNLIKHLYYYEFIDRKEFDMFMRFSSLQVDRHLNKMKPNKKIMNITISNVVTS